MKVFISFLFILSLALCIDAFTGWPGGCKADEDCDETECCIRQGAQFGICLQRPLEGERCIPTGKQSRMYQQASCPCAAGFKCSSSGKRTFPGMKYTKPPTCQAVPETTEPPRTTE
ncbi:uncharacterized protein LOC129225146 [Uloborus diversus]|uniref:uncharacterized protein LOC129225146 n=1 Tax=Uloborus diversus TaxID=327109 RepID=UPI00240A98EA|nr:uncharacterized protein LOC129225146 [Uloborus diversus]